MMNNVLAYAQQSSSTHFSNILKAYVIKDYTGMPGGTGLMTAGSPEPLPRKLMNKGVIILTGLKHSVSNLSILIEHI